MTCAPSAPRVFLFAAAGLALMLAGCSDNAATSQPAKPPPPSVGVLRLEPRAVPLTTELPGRVTAALVSEVRPQVSGVILERAFREGGEVKKGDLLYTLDPAPYQAAYDNASAALRQAQAVLPSARGKLDRYNVLAKQNIVSQQAMDDARAAFGQAQSAVRVAEANVEKARIDLERTRIVAPIDGRIDKSAVTPGALVTAAQAAPLTTIRALDPINIEVTQSSRQLLELRNDIASGRLAASADSVPVKLKLEDGSLYGETGSLRFTEANVSESTGTVTLGATFPNPQRILLPGTYVHALVEQGVARSAYLVPQRAVSRNAKGEAVAWFIGADGKASQRVLEVETAVGNNWLVTKGLNPGDQVALDGLQALRPGVEVKPVAVAINEDTGEVKDSTPPATPAKTPEKAG